MTGKPLVVTVQASYLSKMHLLKRIVAQNMAIWSFAHADVIHVISNNLAEKLRDLGIKNKIVVIPNGVNMAIFKPMNRKRLREEHGFRLNEKIIVSSSRLTPKNGLNYLIKATAEVAKTIKNVRLIIIGDGEQKDELQELIKSLNLEKEAQLFGFVPPAEVPHYLNLADVFVRPSLDEGFGNSFIEAMACRIPVIGTNVGGIPDIIVDGKNGFMVNPADIEGLSEAILKVLTNDALQFRFAEEGYKTVKEKFDWNVVFKKIADVYQTVLTPIKSGA